ncbi:hypothetical protein EVAR_10189_1 [Eumeta japonica]|uniref:Uncharacterized protein n=1 Tax=Eumeta variegata TaxID=151549 RepID=A0A4C1TEE4_EUMVA|nr:hypothetical protein EVAR_10189_1 [Eumeta japonica]
MVGKTRTAKATCTSGLAPAPKTICRFPTALYILLMNDSAQSFSVCRICIVVRFGSKLSTRNFTTHRSCSCCKQPTLQQSLDIRNRLDRNSGPLTTVISDCATVINF